MYYIIAFAVVIMALFFWIISIQRRIVLMEEDINNAMSQIGVQVSSRWDMLASLLELTKGYDGYEYMMIKEVIKSRQSVTKDFSPDDVIKQTNIIDEAKTKIMEVAERYPKLKMDSKYIKTMDAVNIYEKIISTSGLIYNDSVRKLNRAINMFPVSMVIGILEFPRRGYFEAGG